MMSDEGALLATILAHPADDLPRLVLADWWEERGLHDRAEFIRVQCELHRWTDPLKCPQCGGSYDMSIEMDGHAEGGGFLPSAELWCHHDHVWHYGDIDTLRKRERELFERNKCEWFGSSWAILWLDCEQEDSEGQYPESPHAFVRRGFVEAVRLPVAAFMGGECGRCGGRRNAMVRHCDRAVCSVTSRTMGCHCDCSGCIGCTGCDNTGRTPRIATDLFRTQPVTRVEFTDREPFVAGQGFVDWYDVHDDEQDRGLPRLHPASDLPTELFNGLTGGELMRVHMWRYTSADLAVTALSDAAVALGRERAAALTPSPG